MRIAAIQDQWKRVIATQERRETGTQIDLIGKTKNRIAYQIRKPVGVFCEKRKAKSENQMLKNGKFANRNERHNRKTEVS